uniref:Uncharacterized protein n=1 Tax=Timema tahoe TaxID=61484 RepID=A0A7R9IDH5_9NEOP|nr:unnamed protein product [Timema tahoe]
MVVQHRTQVTRELRDIFIGLPYTANSSKERHQMFYLTRRDHHLHVFDSRSKSVLVTLVLHELLSSVWHPHPFGKRFDGGPYGLTPVPLSLLAEEEDFELVNWSPGEENRLLFCPYASLNAFNDALGNRFAGGPNGLIPAPLSEFAELKAFELENWSCGDWFVVYAPGDGIEEYEPRDGFVGYEPGDGFIGYAPGDWFVGYVPEDGVVEYEPGYEPGDGFIEYAPGDWFVGYAPGDDVVEYEPGYVPEDGVVEYEPGDWFVEYEPVDGFIEYAPGDWFVGYAPGNDVVEYEPGDWFVGREPVSRQRVRITVGVAVAKSFAVTIFSWSIVWRLRRGPCLGWRERSVEHIRRIGVAIVDGRQHSVLLPVRFIRLSTSYASELGIGKVEIRGSEPAFNGGRVEDHLGQTTPVHPTEIRTSISSSSTVKLNMKQRSLLITLSPDPRGLLVSDLGTVPVFVHLVLHHLHAAVGKHNVVHPLHVILLAALLVAEVVSGRFVKHLPRELVVGRLLRGQGGRLMTEGVLETALLLRVGAEVVVGEPDLRAEGGGGGAKEPVTGPGDNRPPANLAVMAPLDEATRYGQD